ncbi:hypothetical protein LTR05_000421 [Lithohypha guttulata]|uniref:Major facilitator superfamily (MFS) profile domain-containing protein n=1 Tax=Lithohypha guttulata TaxID=1690604 RepID=A0AAN7T649_9EURO|nr:hypothetical protein LTR05_000421 [Lithohypha guttulata]
MASTIADEKQIHQVDAQHVERHHSDNELQKVSTLGVDLENRDAVKGDNSDGQINWTTKQILATISLSALYVGSQIPLYFVGGSLGYISADIGGADAAAWLPVAYALSLAAVAPFCGYLQDLFGRRNETLLGGLVLIAGVIVLATAKTFGQGVVGMCLAGAGAAVGELTALAGTSELVPVSKRGLYLAFVTFSILPFCPYLMYSELLGHYHTWRYSIWICLIWNALAWIGIAVFYFPESQTRAHGRSTSDLLKKIDYLGGSLSIAGLTLFLVAMQAGGYSHPWTSAYVLVTLIVGLLLIVAFCVWEWKFAKYPMIPHEMFAGQKIVGMAFGIAFVAGMNFYALLNFFPLMFSAVFEPDPVQIGLKGLAPAFSTTFGAVFTNAALTWFKGNNRELLLAATVIMTVFGGSLAAVTPETPKLAVGLGTMAGFGVGGVLVPAATIAITVTPDTTIATCVALSLAIRTIGGSIGYAIYYNVFVNRLTPRLPAYVGAYAVEAGLPVASATEFVTVLLTDPSKIAAVPGVTAEIIQAGAMGSRWAYAESLRNVWLVSIAFGGCAIVACIFLGNISKYMTNRIAAHVK